jgi:Glycosyl hydrolase family 30 TIM-barrel domain
MKQSIVLSDIPAEPRINGGPPGPVQVHVTDRDRRFEADREVPWQVPRDTSAGSLNLNPNTTFQEILGFGAALTDAACYLLDKLPASRRKEFLHEIFNPAAMGLNTCRVCIGASDYSTELYSYDEGSPDPTLERFSIDHDRAYILPALSDVRELCPDLFLLASPWSPPGWMKVGGSMRGGSIQRKHFATYAEYFLKFLDAYAAAGIAVDAVTVQNEVDTDQEGLMPACLWPQTSEMRFIAEHLGPRFAERGIRAKIWLLDHNYDLWGRALSELEDPKVRQFMDGVAWHGYAGKPSSMTVVHEAYPDKHTYWTEGGPEDLHDPHLQTNWTFWGVRFTAEAVISRANLSESSPFAIADLSAAYARDAISLQRGAALLSSGVLIQDEIVWRADSKERAVRWQMMTDAEIALAGAEATLTKNGQYLGARILSPHGAHFAVASAQQKAPQNPNSGFRQLVIDHSESGAETRIPVLLFTKPLQLEERKLNSW